MPTDTTPPNATTPSTPTPNTPTPGAPTPSVIAPRAFTPTETAPFVDAVRFAALVEQPGRVALVDFTADHCPPCRMLSPHVDTLARELSGRAVVVKVDVDDQPALAARFGVRGTPTVILFRNGQAVDRILGAVPVARLRAGLQAILERDPLTIGSVSD